VPKKFRIFPTHDFLYCIQKRLWLRKDPFWSLTTIQKVLTSKLMKGILDYFKSWCLDIDSDVPLYLRILVGMKSCLPIVPVTLTFVDSGGSPTPQRRQVYHHRYKCGGRNRRSYIGFAFFLCFSLSRFITSVWYHIDNCEASGLWDVTTVYLRLFFPLFPCCFTCFSL